MRFVLLLALVACKGKSEAVHTASCNAPTSRTCEDYESTGPAYLKNRQADCDQIKGTWANAACATTGLVGSCRETTESFTRTRHYYGGTTVDLERTKVECGQFGKWLEPSQQ